MNFLKNKKKEIFTILAILIFSCIISSNYLKMHYAQDTYSLVELGYKVYNELAFLPAGRPISALTYCIADFLHLSVKTHVFILTCFSILFLSLSVYIIYRTMVKILKIEKDNIKSFWVLIISFFTIFNFCTNELLIFVESGVMTLGLLLSIVSACMWASDNKNRYVYMFIYALIGVICYQGVLNIYVPLSLIIIVAKNKENIKKAFKEAFVTLFIYGIELILSRVIGNLINLIFSIESRAAIIPSITRILSTYVKYFKFLVIDTLDIFPHGVYLGIMGIIFIIYLIYVLKYKYPKIYIFYYVSIFLSAILLPILPVVIQAEDAQYIEARMAISLGASAGLMILYMMITVDVEKSLILKNVNIIISVIIFTLSCQYVIQASDELIATNLIDRNIAILIDDKISDYEKENNVKINNIAVDFDENPNYYYHGSRTYRCVSYRSLATDWEVANVLKTFAGRNLNKIELPEEIHEKYFKGKDWNYYDEEQLVFIGDTVYLCVY